MVETHRVATQMAYEEFPKFIRVCVLSLAHTFSFKLRAISPLFVDFHCSFFLISAQSYSEKGGNYTQLETKSVGQ